MTTKVPSKYEADEKSVPCSTPCTKNVQLSMFQLVQGIFLESVFFFAFGPKLHSLFKKLCRKYLKIPDRNSSKRMLLTADLFA